MQHIFYLVVTGVYEYYPYDSPDEIERKAYRDCVQGADISE